MVTDNEREIREGLRDRAMNKDNVSAALMAIGVIGLIVGFAIYFNSPSLNKAASSQQQIEKLVSSSTMKNANGDITTIKLDKSKFQNIDKSQFRKAPEFTQISGYINTKPNLKLADLKGKVVLVDFWTYTCINCIRTIPYLNDWNHKYADKGLVIVGVHSPEFEFEKNYNNVEAAVQKYGIKYPVIQDNDHGTWNAYGNQYWPRDYLIDADGYIRHDHIGEGDYATTEKAIQSLLAERASFMGMKEISFNTPGAKAVPIVKPGSLQSIDLTKNITPEIYMGYFFARAPLGNPQNFEPDQTVSYTIPSTSNFQPDRVYLEGQWKNNRDNMELRSDTGRIILSYYAKALNIVASGKGQLGTVTGDDTSKTTIPTSAAKTSDKPLGIDLSKDGKFILDGQRLYNLALYNDYGAHSIIIDVRGKGFQIYTFTFG